MKRDNDTQATDDGKLAAEAAGDHSLSSWIKRTLWLEAINLGVKVKR
ncbi:hypothetical protein ACFL34_03720 [Candidatus Sumerlaeota bacterium]